MNTIPIGQNAGSIFDAANFTPLQVYNLVTQTNKAFKMGQANMPKVMRELSKLNGSTGSILSGTRTYKFPRIGNQFPYAVSGAAAVLSNGNKTATITLTDSSYKEIGVGSYISDTSTGVSCKVTSISAGVITADLSFSPSGSTVLTANDFAANNQISFIGYNGGTRVYKAQEQGTPLPHYDTYQIGQFTADAFVKAEDANQATWFKLNGQNYYAAKEEMYKIDLMHSAMYNYYLGNYGAIGGENPLPASFLNQLKQYGAMTQSKAANLSLNDFEDIATDFMRQGSVSDGTEMFVFCGLDYAKNISRVLRPYVQTAGTNNILKATSGLDIRRFEVSGLVLNVVVEMYFENKNQVGAGKSDSAYWVCADGAYSEDGKYIPPIVDVYYGQEGLQRSVILGKKDLMGKHVANPVNDQPFSQVSFEMNAAKVITDVQKCMYHGN